VTLRFISAALVWLYGWERLTELGRNLVVLVTRLDMECASTEHAARGGRVVDIERYEAMANLRCSAIDELDENNLLTGYRELRESNAIKHAVGARRPAGPR
jgi:hypothetical protein